MNEWNIQSRSNCCELCQRAFADQQAYHTLLFEDKGELRRQDVCDACWRENERDSVNARKGFLSYWQGVYETPPPAPPDPIRKETAESLLRKLIELNDPAHGPACYILAAMLERKRLLKVKEQLVRDGRRQFIYEQPRTGDLFTIADPNLQLDQLDAVQRDVAHLLEHGLTPPAPDPAGSEPADKNQSPPASEDAHPAEDRLPADESIPASR